MNDYFVSFVVQTKESHRFNSGVVSFEGPLNEFAMAGLRRQLAEQVAVGSEEVVILNVLKLERED